MCLLDNLLKLKDVLEVKEIVVAHLNHMIRQEAKEETEYVEEYCNKNNIRCFVKYEDIIKEAKEQKIGTEEAGRKARYDFLNKLQAKQMQTKLQ